jgi:RNA polymerase sigma factor (sigma-70 family)
MRLVLVDDHKIFRMGIADLLAGTPWRIVGEAGRARDAFALLDSQQPDLVLLDLALPGMDGVVATREMRRRAPRTRILIFTVHDQMRDVVDALRAGASGYALKTEDAPALLEALATVMRGERYLAPAIAARLAQAQSSDGASDLLAPLSEREREVFRLAAECLSTREIASELCISRKTVDTHLYRTYQKLGLRTLAELVSLAARLGMIHSGRPRRG